MSNFVVHDILSGCKLVTDGQTSILLGQPIDAFKATDVYCRKNNVPFPSVMVMPDVAQRFGVPQIAAEFFTLDRLFRYGMAFKPELKNERQTIIGPMERRDLFLRSLRWTLVGPNEDEMRSWQDHEGKQALPEAQIKVLNGISQTMAIRSWAEPSRPRTVEEIVDYRGFGANGLAEVRPGLAVKRLSGNRFEVIAEGQSAIPIDLNFSAKPEPFLRIGLPSKPIQPARLAVIPLGTYSGFESQGPSTGFLLFVNGDCILVDGPPGTPFLLGQLGIATKSVRAHFVTHIHEDHIGAVLEMILGGHAVKLHTTEAVYHCLLAKLSLLMDLPEDEVRHYVNYQRIHTGKMFRLLGANIEPFATVHPIPCFGLKVSVRDHDGSVWSVTISSDNHNNAGIDELFAKGVIPKEMVDRLKTLAPRERDDHAVTFIDVGGPPIHGKADDWKDNPNRIYFYHAAPEKIGDALKTDRHKMALAGDFIELLGAQTYHPAVAHRVIEALNFAELDDPTKLIPLMFQGRLHTYQPGETIVAEGKVGDPDTEPFYVIVSGNADVVVTVNGQRMKVNTLTSGNFFGEIAILKREPRTASIIAGSISQVFAIPGQEFLEFVTKNNLQRCFEAIWERRPIIAAGGIFRDMPPEQVNHMANHATVEDHARGKAIIREGEDSSEYFYLLTRGAVEVSMGGRAIRTIRSSDEDCFFGEMVALDPGRRRNATVKATEDARVLRVAGPEIRRLYKAVPIFRYRIAQVIRKRTGTGELPAIV